MTIEKEEINNIVSDRISSFLSETSFNFSLNGLQKIHFLLFNGISEKAGKFRNKFNPRKKEVVLNGNSVKYSIDSEISRVLKELIDEEQHFNYSKLTDKEKILHISHFFSDLWRIHPFYDGNTRATTLFVIKRMRQIGFVISNKQFECNALYYRNSLVRSAYETKRIPRDFSFLQQFLINIIEKKQMDNLTSESLKIVDIDVETPTLY